jgi:allophanate hydrolase subunit 2
MRDAQTTGGYAKIAVVITADVSVLGQARPNDIVEFVKVTMHQAQEKLFEYRKLLESLERILAKE